MAGNDRRLTEYHGGIAVIRDKAMLSRAMQKLAYYEDVETSGCEGCARYGRGDPDYLEYSPYCTNCIRGKHDFWTGGRQDGREA